MNKLHIYEYINSFGSLETGCDNIERDENWVIISFGSSFFYNFKAILLSFTTGPYMAWLYYTENWPILFMFSPFLVPGFIYGILIGGLSKRIEINRLSGDVNICTSILYYKFREKFSIERINYRIRKELVTKSSRYGSGHSYDVWVLSLDTPASYHIIKGSRIQEEVNQSFETMGKVLPLNYSGQGVKGVIERINAENEFTSNFIDSSDMKLVQKVMDEKTEEYAEKLETTRNDLSSIARILVEDEYSPLVVEADKDTIGILIPGITSFRDILELWQIPLLILFLVAIIINLKTVDPRAFILFFAWSILFLVTGYKPLLSDQFIIDREGFNYNKFVYLLNIPVINLRCSWSEVERIMVIDSSGSGQPTLQINLKNRIIIIESNLPYQDYSKLASVFTAVNPD